jgi:catechol 2,3-dioxygenase-like lactoylglutathione lyase family enzyme
MDIFSGRQTTLHHVGIICRSEDAAAQLMGLLGLQERYRGYVPTYQALCIFCGKGEGGDVELVIPSGGTLGEFNRGLGGLHHVAIAVPSLSDLERALTEAGIKLLEDEPVRGAGAFNCNFVSPVYTGGVTIEFVELDP